jgi:hypothetical protein
VLLLSYVRTFTSTLPFFICCACFELIVTILHLHNHLRPLLLLLVLLLLLLLPLLLQAYA